MEHLLEALIQIMHIGTKLWRSILTNTPLKNLDECRKLQRHVMLYYYALDGNEFNIIFVCEMAKEVWDTLVATHEGISEVNESK